MLNGDAERQPNKKKNEEKKEMCLMVRVLAEMIINSNGAEPLPKHNTHTQTQAQTHLYMANIPSMIIHISEINCNRGRDTLLSY